MKKLGVLALIFVAVLAWKVSNYGKPPGPHKLSKSEIRQIEREMDSLVREQRKELPKQVNPFITWTKLSLSGKELRYIYVIDEKKLPAPVSAVVDQIDNQGKNESLKTLNSDPNTKIIVDSGYTFRFIYQNQIGKTLTEYSVGDE